MILSSVLSIHFWTSLKRLQLIGFNFLVLSNLKCINGRFAFSLG